MKSCSTALFLSLTLLTLIGTSSFSAKADPVSQIPNLGDLGFTQALLKMYKLDAAARNQLFDVRNKKGESIFTQSQAPQNNLWSTLDPSSNGIEGTSTDKLYKNFKISAGKNEVVVAVIDTGVDINHEDLKGHIWINLPEFTGKLGVDDDEDGYIDDIYGWNFLGNADGTNVLANTLEVTRIYKSLQAKVTSGQALSPDETALLAEVTQKYQNGLSQAQSEYNDFQSYSAAITLLKANGLTNESLTGLSSVTSVDPLVLQAAQIAKVIFTAGKTSVEMGQALTYFKSEIDFNYNLNFDSSSVVKDNPAVMDDIGYGNGDVIGPDATHGTHIAGIIAANRQNNIGINGQALNVKIMPLRVVPEGDERDKDVANAIRFATDHGARIINMSFGKNYSPHKDYVDSAMKYAESMGVILVHSSGDESLNSDLPGNTNYPTRVVPSSAGATRGIETWLEVGASTKIKGLSLPAAFSNYGKTTVDLFAPGEEIISTVPGNQYASMSGTGQACAEVAGVAAILLELYPYATALEVKNAILLGVNQYAGLSVYQPTSPGTLSPGQNPPTVNFSDLSASGGTINADEGMLKMEQTTVR